MQLGYFLMPVHPPEKDFTQSLEEDLELIGAGRGAWVF